MVKHCEFIPDSFWGGSAPRLRHFELSGIPFPGLPKLLLSATHLNHLSLSGIPHSGYFSPEAMVALLSVLSCLNFLELDFQSFSLALTGKSDAPIHQNVLSSPLSMIFVSKGSSDI